MTFARRLRLIAGVSATIAVLTACSHAPRATGAAGTAPAAGATQLVLVLADDWDAATGTLQRYRRDRPGAAWRAVGDPAPVALGRSGSGWGTGLHPAVDDGGPVKREGDGRAPAGVFAIGTAFGYVEPAAVDSGLPYRQMDASDWCIDVPASPLYNRIVSSDAVGTAAVEGSTEPMRRDLHQDGDVRYRLGFVIEHNTTAVAGGGSCIFAHLWRTPGEATAGCTAMDEAAMRALLAWLDPAAAPVFVLLPRAAHAQLQSRWDLPPAR